MSLIHCSGSRGWLVGVLLIGGCMASTAGAASPSLSLILPRGCQRGSEVELSFRGARLADAQEVFFYDAGLEAVKLEAKKANELKVRVKVAADCRLGEHVAQVRTASGLSEFRTFYVGPFPTVVEKEPNSDFAQPQPIPLNVTVEGVIQNEDVDFFVIEAKKGQRISCEIEGMRLGSALFDPYLAILDSRRFELAAADDTPLLRQDAAVAVVAPADGRYIVEVRESAYGGNNNCRYRLHVGTFPRPTAAYPPGGKLGTEMEVRFLGDVAGPFAQKVKLPDQPQPRFGLEARQGDQIAPSPVPFRLWQYDNVLETEPNNDLKQATSGEVPCAFNGIIETPGDVDCFKFRAKKGAVFDVECYARRLRSPLDPVMNLYNAAGRRLTGNDDARGPDSYFRFTAPADGEYIVRVSDHLGRGGPDFVYRIEVAPPRPSLTVTIPRVARYSQYRQWLVVPRGNRFGTLVSIRRTNFGGPVVLAPEGLPKGLTLHAEPFPPNMTVMPVVLEAAADAPIAGGLVDLIARHAEPKQSIWGRYENTADLVLGPPNQSAYWQCTVDRLATAVTEEVPFHLEIVPPKVPIVRNGSMRIKVRAIKKKGWDGDITLQFPFQPPGIGTVPSVKMPKGKNEAEYPITASGNARIQKWPVFVLGSADVNGAVWVSSQMVTLEVVEPFVTFAMQRAAVEQGQQTEIVCQVTHNRPFEGKAKVRLLGLPAKTSTVELELTKETKELVFPITTAKDTPAGNHKNIFCQVIIVQNGEPITHARVGGTELRVDKPLPPKTKTPAQPKPVAKKPKTKPPAKPVRLSRLQQLRLQAKQNRRAATSAGENPSGTK